MIFEYTPREQARLDVILEEIKNLTDEMAEAIDKQLDIDDAQIEKIENGQGDEVPEYKEFKEKYYRQLNGVIDRYTDLVRDLDNERFSKLTTAGAILEDAKNQVQAAIIYTYGNAIAFQQRRTGRREKNEYDIMMPAEWMRAKIYKEFKAGKITPDPEDAEIKIDGVKLISYIKTFVINRHVDALKGTPEAEQLESYIVQAMANSPYVSLGKQEQSTSIIPVDELLNNSWLTVYHGKPTDQLARINTRSARYDAYSESTVIDNGVIKVVFNDFNNITGRLGINEHKLLSVAVAYFTDRNNYSRGNLPARNLDVYIPLKEYAAACNYNVDERPTSTPEDAAAEKKRAANALNDARKKIKNSLDVLYSISLSWKESRPKGGQRDFEDMRIIQNKGIKKGYIKIKFSDDFGNVLLSYPLTQYPSTLLGIDPRNPNAYRIGQKMAEHHNIDSNQMKGTANILQVDTLLKCTDLPDIDTIRQQRASWDRRIKEPFENALDLLVKQGVLHDWKYTKAKGEDLTDEEASNITSYVIFEKLYIVYELKDAPDHTERLARREEEKRTAEEKQDKKKKRTSSKRSS